MSFKLSPMADTFFVSTCNNMFQNVVKVQYYLNPIKDNLYCMEMTKLYCYVESIMADHSHLDNIPAVACDFKQYGILTSVNSNEPVQPPFKLRNSQ